MAALNADQRRAAEWFTERLAPEFATWCEGPLVRRAMGNVPWDKMPDDVRVTMQKAEASRSCSCFGGTDACESEMMVRAVYAALCARMVVRW